jgi:pantoate--beta-alanine ligase
VPDVVATLAEWRERTDALRASGSSIGLTMTMGALHEGHASLFRRAAEECDVAVATIFVNPLQFENPDDLGRYQIDLAADLDLAATCGVALVLAPSVEEIWPDWPEPTATRVSVLGLSGVLEGADRPGHFDGVASVVTKLLVATGRCRAYFGEKDYQQLCIVRRLVADLALRADVVGCPIVREPDGLARSSRNARLSASSRRAATVLWRALDAARELLESAGTVEEARDAMCGVVGAESSVQLAYAAVVEPATLRPLDDVAAGTEVRILIAATVEGVRLIDNVRAVAGSRS